MSITSKTYIDRIDAIVGDEVHTNGHVHRVVELLGYDEAGRHGIRWSNGVTEYSPPSQVITGTYRRLQITSR